MTSTDEDCFAETLKFNERFAAAAASRPAREGMPDATLLATLRRNRLGGDTPPVRLPQGQDRVIAGGVNVRAFTPDHVDGVYLHIHGGGWAFGSADGQDERLWWLAEQARLAVVSVEYYRLAPEHPFPAGPDDCEAAARWLVDQATAEFGTERLLIGGESAGAHLSVVTLLRLRDRHGITGAFRAAHLLFGPYDLSIIVGRTRPQRSTQSGPPAHAHLTASALARTRACHRPRSHPLRQLLRPVEPLDEGRSPRKDRERDLQARP